MTKPGKMHCVIRILKNNMWTGKDETKARILGLLKHSDKCTFNNSLWLQLLTRLYIFLVTYSWQACKFIKAGKICDISVFHNSKQNAGCRGSKRLRRGESFQSSCNFPLANWALIFQHDCHSMHFNSKIHINATWTRGTRRPIWYIA